MTAAIHAENLFMQGVKNVTAFELWLDESGDFEQDSKGLDSPSIVGGILFKKGLCDDAKARQLLDEVKTNHSLSGWVHGTSIPRNKYGNFAVELLHKGTEAGLQLVIFENKERIEIVNGDTTYLNILSEGVIQLMQTLSMEHEEIELRIVAANRHKREDAENRKEIILIGDKEYTSRLEEKITLSLARQNVSNWNGWSWTFERKSARTEPLLMIADVVCHTWFRKDGNKFNHQHREQLKPFYNPLYIYSVFEHATISSIKRLIADGSIGNALFEWIVMNTEELKGTAAFELSERQIGIVEVILSRMEKLPSSVLNTQLMHFVHKIKSLIDMERNFIKSKDILLFVQEFIIPRMKEHKIDTDAFYFQIYFMLLEIANHRGDVIEADSLIKKCREMLPQLAGRWEYIDDVLEYLVRESVHKSNIYDFAGAIDAMDQVQAFIEGTFELFPLGLKDELSLMTKGMKSDILGKVAGTRLQARIFLGRDNHLQYEQARIDSETALNEFNERDDQTRQYQYRSQLECDAGESHTSFAWLVRSFQMNADSEITPTLLLEEMKNRPKASFLFGCMHFTRLLSETIWNEQIPMAEEMYDAWVKSKIDETLSKTLANEHPFEIILWKLASYLIQTGSVKAALEKYDQAINICMKNKEQLTLFSIGLGITAERAGFLLKEGQKYKNEIKKAFREMNQTYDAFITIPGLPAEMKTYFQAWKEPLDSLQKLNDNEKAMVLLKLSRTIPY